MTSPQDLRARTDQLLELHESGELDVALARADELVSAAADHDPADPVVRESLFAASFERAVLLTELGELDEAAHAYEAAARVPVDPADPDQRHEVAMALLNRGICLDALGEHEAAVAGYAQLIDRFGTATDPVTVDQVVRGRVNRAAALLVLGRLEPVLEATGALIDELDGAEALEAEQLGIALRLRAAALRSDGRDREALSTLAEVARCTSDDPAVREQVAAAHHERATLLGELGRLPEALEVVEAALAELTEQPAAEGGTVLELERLRAELGHRAG